MITREFCAHEANTNWSPWATVGAEMMRKYKRKHTHAKFHGCFYWLKVNHEDRPEPKYSPVYASLDAVFTFLITAIEDGVGSSFFGMYLLLF